MVFRNILLTVAYDGTEYHGWQIQPGKKTVQGELSEAVRKLFGGWKSPDGGKAVKPTIVHGASRTDAGVSALGQRGLFQLPSSNPMPVENMPRAITQRLPRDMAVTGAAEVSAGFDLIGSVKNKLYRYSIFTGKDRLVFNRTCWHLPSSPDIGKMACAAKFLVGTKDFKSFAAAADRRQSSVRTVFRCEVAGETDWIYVDIEADGFLYNMARNIVGTLVDFGYGRLRQTDMAAVLEAKDRTAAGTIAPPEGLCLMWIKY